MSDLIALLRRLDGRPYPAYRDLAGRPFALDRMRIVVDHVQADPFAPPSRLRLEVPPDASPVPAEACGSRDARRAAADVVHRAIARVLAGRDRGGGDGMLAIAAPGPAVLERTAVVVLPDRSVVIRLAAGLPAAGRRILGRTAATLLGTTLPAAIAAAGDALDPATVRRHVEVVDDAVALRAALAAHRLIAFLADGSILPRRSGVDDAPLPGAVPLAAPPALAVQLDTPHAGRLRGLGIPRGVTVLAGGGYHGKSTLLDAIAQGIDDHPPGDGRERCVTDAAAVAVRAEDGRAVRGVDLRPFIRALPLGRATDRFDSDDASGSTSQAAAIVEALEAGARVLLIDEDTAASNFMVRDARMRRLVAPEDEPITPFIDRVRQLHDVHGVSSVLVVGGAGDYLDVADTVIALREYVPDDVTARARAVATALPLGDARPRPPGPWAATAPRVPDPHSLDARAGGRRERVRAVRGRSIQFGDEHVDVALVAQLAEEGQRRFVGDALLAFARGLADGRRSIADLLDAIDGAVERDGIGAIAAPTFGDRARARRFEIAAALNRLRALRLVGRAPPVVRSQGLRRPSGRR